jgi:NADH-quinone oxidoreductase subunit L
MFTAIVFLPLLGSIVTGFFGRRIGDRASQVITCAMLGISLLLSILVFGQITGGGHPVVVRLFTWFVSGDTDVAWSLRFDALTAVMLIVVNTVSFLVHVYSVGYMHHDPHVPRFMSYLSFFTFSMLMLVTANNLVQLFFGWEGVGLASYLLIGFWYERPSANAAAIKAFVVNRVGDFGFALGIFAIFVLFDSVNFDAIFGAAPDKANAFFDIFGIHAHALTAICLLLFMGAMGKSAQIFLHTWLPDAMEGPTPVSALIHAATMVTAGVFMVARMSPLFELSDTALTVVTLVGAATAFFAGTIGCVQNDIKRVIAYSTCSQLGYMFFGLGVSAYQAGIFHLFTHAFFKALLFLGAGSVIHAMSDEQDIRKMGGIWRYVPLTYIVMLIGSLALAGIPPFAGWWSKDAILESAWASGTDVGHFAYVLGVLAVFMTAFYSFRLLILTFHGKPRADEHVMAHVHESPLVMTVPLVLLAVGAVFAGGLGNHAFIGEGMDHFWSNAIVVLKGHDALANRESLSFVVSWLPTLVALLGIGLAVVMYVLRPSLPRQMAETMRPIYLFMLNKWYFDELYDFIFVRPAFWIGRGFWKEGDGALIDGYGPDGISALSRTIARRFSFLQTGYLYHYAFAMLAGVAIFVTWYIVRMG